MNETASNLIEQVGVHLVPLHPAVRKMMTRKIIYIHTYMMELLVGHQSPNRVVPNEYQSARSPFRNSVSTCAT